ncbi:MAG: hypothetical protein ACREMV_04240 [Gemmatimonadales bacterium]
MRWAFLRTAPMILAALWAAPLTAQAGDSVPRDTMPARDTLGTVPPPVVTPPSPPPPPTPEQERFREGLRTASRGVAQLRSGVGQVRRASAGTDTTARRRAAHTLAGLCTAARDFLSRGRAGMQPMVFEDTTRVKARRLTVQIDTLIKFMPTCTASARGQPDGVRAELETKLKSYDAALRDFQAAAGKY